MPVLKIEDLRKEFFLHQQGGVRIDVFDEMNLTVNAGESVSITGPSGKGKSSLLKLIYGTYRATSGRVLVQHAGAVCDIALASPQDIIETRRVTIGYVTQFLRVIPRVPAEVIVAEPLIDRGLDRETAIKRARHLLGHLNIPERLWHLSPMTFSGGEQQRVNIARGFAAHFPLLLVDEPTASLDKENRNRVLELIEDARKQGSAIIGVFHDGEERARICSAEINLQ
ncbi:MAG: phosphonate C-P lyase system protein PhnL [Pseudomonadota bacterium]|nr:phosphonate C-P lyase system protein PhnL [Pseudomonadota bacterium]